MWPLFWIAPPGKTLCDVEGEFLRDQALALLQEGLRRGLVSRQSCGDWPQNVWAVSEELEVFESRLENQATGTYHGYPMPAADDFRKRVLKEWELRAH